MDDFYNIVDDFIQYQRLHKRYESRYKEYIQDIRIFFAKEIRIENIYFNPKCVLDDKDGRRVHPTLSFTTYVEIPSRLMLNFCDEFNFYSPTFMMQDDLITRRYSFVKKINWDKIRR